MDSFESIYGGAGSVGALGNLTNRSNRRSSSGRTFTPSLTLDPFKWEDGDPENRGGGAWVARTPPPVEGFEIITSSPTVSPRAGSPSTVRNIMLQSKDKEALLDESIRLKRALHEQAFFLKRDKVHASTVRIENRKLESDIKDLEFYRPPETTRSAGTGSNLRNKLKAMKLRYEDMRELCDVQHEEISLLRRDVRVTHTKELEMERDALLEEITRLQKEVEALKSEQSRLRCEQMDLANTKEKADELECINLSLEGCMDTINKDLDRTNHEVVLSKAKMLEQANVARKNARNFKELQEHTASLKDFIQAERLEKNTIDKQLAELEKELEKVEKQLAAKGFVRPPTPNYKDVVSRVGVDIANRARAAAEKQAAWEACNKALAARLAAEKEAAAKEASAREAANKGLSPRELAAKEAAEKEAAQKKASAKAAAAKEAAAREAAAKEVAAKEAAAQRAAEKEAAAREAAAKEAAAKEAAAREAAEKEAAAREYAAKRAEARQAAAAAKAFAAEAKKTAAREAALALKDVNTMAKQVAEKHAAVAREAAVAKEVAAAKEAAKAKEVAAKKEVAAVREMRAMSLASMTGTKVTVPLTLTSRSVDDISTPRKARTESEDEATVGRTAEAIAKEMLDKASREVTAAKEAAAAREAEIAMEKEVAAKELEALRQALAAMEAAAKEAVAREAAASTEASLARESAAREAVKAREAVAATQGQRQGQQVGPVPRLQLSSRDEACQTSDSSYDEMIRKVRELEEALASHRSETKSPVSSTRSMSPVVAIHPPPPPQVKTQNPLDRKMSKQPASKKTEDSRKTGRKSRMEKAEASSGSSSKGKTSAAAAESSPPAPEPEVRTRRLYNSDASYAEDTKQIEEFRPSMKVEFSALNVLVPKKSEQDDE